MNEKRLRAMFFVMVLWRVGLSTGAVRMKEGAEMIRTCLPESVPYGTGSWDANSLGNHRAVIDVSHAGGDAVAVHIPWRRRDLNPEKKAVILTDAETNRRVANVFPVEINREFGEFVFEPLTVPGIYYMYYMPYEMSGRHYPEVTYLEPETTWQASWLEGCGYVDGNLPEERWLSLPKAGVVEIQSIDEFNSFYPMEVIATAAEVRELLAEAPDASYLLFPEDREYPIRMTDSLPLRWIEKGLHHSFEGDCLRGEFYAFQIGVYAARRAISDIDVLFGDMKGPAGSVIPAAAQRCFNLGGVDWEGEAFTKVCSVEKGKVRALWFGIGVPASAMPGRYEGNVTVVLRDAEPTGVRIVLTVEDRLSADRGDSDPWRHSRLRWLDSKIALDNDIVEPFVSLQVDDTSIRCLGRTVTLAETGFPRSIRSHFAPEVTHLVDAGREILSGPIRLRVEADNDRAVPWRVQGPRIVEKSAAMVTWKSEGACGSLRLSCHGQMECDGFLGYTVKLVASETTSVRDIRLEIPIAEDVAKYMMGMGLKGGLRPPEHHWKWDPAKNQDAVWVGDTHAGLQCSLRAENYSRPLNTNFYLSKPLNMPPSWYNEGKGGCHIRQTDDNTIQICAYSGARTIEAGGELYFNFNLLVTPFKTLDTRKQWSTRFYHSYRPIAEIAKTGANTVNNHHANEVNPYINYPFISTRQMKDYVDEAHEQGMKVKIYYTVRELSNRCPEIFALRSLSDEILSYGPGGGFAWLQEHLGSSYIAGWFVPRFKDAAVINSGVSRWHNYYLEGLNWLANNIQIDGLYIDDVAFDRTVMKRARKILDHHRPGALIDLHSANQYNVRDGFVNSANLYLEHFPYIDRLWFGEYFDYNSPPDFWLVEVSGICFGLMGEMLQDGGNPWRGMIYGMTARLPREEIPARLWKVWDDFGMQDTRMVGYWSPSCPVRTNHEDILATAYVKKGKTLISIASWASSTVNCRLALNWDTLKMDPRNARLTAPHIDGFQSSASFALEDEIPVAPGEGWLLILSGSNSTSEW